MKSQRLTLLISPEEKRHFTKMAADQGITTSELVRQAVRAYGVSSFGVSSINDARELAALTAELREALPSIRKSVRSANASAERALASIASRKVKR